MRWSSSKYVSADEKRILINLACRYARATLMSEGVVLGSSFIPSPRHPTLEGDSLRSELTLLLSTSQIASIEL